MHRLAKPPLVVYLLLLCVGSSALSGEKLLRVLSWTDYFEPALISKFQRQFNCRVQIKNFESYNDMHAILKTGAAEYDLITPPQFMVQLLRDRGMLMEINPSLVPNLPNLDRDILARGEQSGIAKHAVPYTRGVTGIGYNKWLVRDGGGSWGVLARSDLAGRMMMLGDMRENFAVALLYLGHDPNTGEETEIRAAADLLISWQKNLVRYDMDQGKLGLASGDLLVVHGYNGDVGLAMLENQDIEFAVPREGATMSLDYFVIPVVAYRPDLAHAFVNFMLEVENARLNMEGILYAMPVPEALEQLDEGVRGSPSFTLTKEVIARCHIIRDLGEDNAKYIREWARVKAAE